jgi:Na+/H+ antiporter NhaD/arsenite permease-like protein
LLALRRNGIAGHLTGRSAGVVASRKDGIGGSMHRNGSPAASTASKLVPAWANAVPLGVLRLFGLGLFAFALLSGSSTVEAAAPGGFSGRDLGLVWILPFVGILLSIAIMPLAMPNFWHHHFGKVALVWALAFCLPFAVMFGASTTLHEVLHTALLEYIPFIVLITALYVVAGGIFIRGNIHGSPATNTAMLAFGAFIASFVGTTGASMLMIRPIIRANDDRPYNMHVFVFFIFLVSNIGGALTPLGDPPLFLGFLQGVEFFWTLKHLWQPTLLVSAILLALFYVIDSYHYKKEGRTKVDPTPDMSIGVEGWQVNVPLLAVLVGIVLWSGIVKTLGTVSIYGIEVDWKGIVRDGGLIAVAALSILLTPKAAREGNGFSWGPVLEVAKLFAAIFITIIPALAILRVGTDGALAGLVQLVTGPGGKPIDPMYFWLTGTLSSFLDNAPTYLVFYNLAGGDAQTLMGPLATTLAAISLGAVFMGANTYIGNAPNFMVKAVVEDRGIKMPSFFGYMGWSCVILLPCFALVTVLFF